MISIRDLHKTFYRSNRCIEVLKGIALNIHAGESVAIIGVSGVGKSTFLHIVGALERPTKGEVFYPVRDKTPPHTIAYGKLRGRQVSDGCHQQPISNGAYMETSIFSLKEVELAAFRNRTVGFVFQFHHLLPEFNALENVILPLLIMGCKRRKARERGREVLNQVGLDGRMSHRPGELSGGEQQRVAVARALVTGPAVILADEPTGNLDSKTGEAIIDLLLRIREYNEVTLIIVTHNPKIAERMERRLLMSDGRLFEYNPSNVHTPACPRS